MKDTRYSKRFIGALVFTAFLTALFMLLAQYSGAMARQSTGTTSGASSMSAPAHETETETHGNPGPGHGSRTPEPEETETHEPHQTETQQPHQTETQQPHQTETQEPHETETHEPQTTRTPEPTETEHGNPGPGHGSRTPQPTETEHGNPGPGPGTRTRTRTPEPEETETEEPHGTRTRTPEPEETETHEPHSTRTPEPEETETHEPHATRTVPPPVPTGTVRASVTSVSASVPGTGSRLFQETGKTVSGIFLQYWDSKGGLAQQGYPISSPMQERSSLDGKTYTVQYFERAVFEYHPENSAPYNILLSQLGTFQYKQKYPNGAPNQIANKTGGQFFPQTGYWIGGAFLKNWQQQGGLAQQGYPISNEFQEKSPLDGKTYTVQYFERSVFELHPENKAPYNILLSQLGTFQYKTNYIK